jgi:hypothetical protein
MTCEEFTSRMAQLVASGEDVCAHPHVRRCKMHRALLEDLEAIARAARQLFPEVDPSDRVWTKIKDEIAPADGLDDRVSDPFPGCHLVFRVRTMRKWNSRDNPEAYDEPMGAPPHPEEGRR